MHILITGGSGFIGRALSRSAVHDGHRVTVLTRDPARARARLPGSVTPVPALDAVGAVDAVVNLAGENLAAGRWSAARKQAFRASRIDATRRLVAWMAAQAQRPGVLVSGSAIGWYGPRGDDVLTEDAAPGADFSAQLCRDWEAAAVEAEALGVRVCRVRTGIVLGAEDGALKRMLTPFRLGIGGRIGTGRQWMSWIARDDLVALIRWLIDTPATQGAYNGTAPAPVRNAEFAQVLALRLHRPALVPMPAFALRLLFGEMADLLLTGQRVVPECALAAGFRFGQPDLPGALAAILG